MSTQHNPRSPDGESSISSSEQDDSNIPSEEEDDSDGDNQFDTEARFPHPLDEFRSDEPHCSLLTFKELLVRELSAQIREKPDWTQKIQDRKLFQKWVLESRKYWEADIKERFCNYLVPLWDADSIRYAYTELYEHYAPWAKEQGQSGILPVIDCVWKTDGRIGDDLRQELIQAVKTLEDIPEGQKDWHPGSNQQVLDLVHPSLFPVIYDRSISVETGQTVPHPLIADVLNPGEVIGSDTGSNSISDREGYGLDEPFNIDNGWSNRFAWLPADFIVSKDGKTTIDSYINNLNMDGQPELFNSILERIFDAFVPMFNLCLAELHDESYTRERVDFYKTCPSTCDVERFLSVENHDKLDSQNWETFLSGGRPDLEYGDYLQPVEKGDSWERFIVNEDGSHSSKDEWTGYRAFELGDFNKIMWTPPSPTEECKLENRLCPVIVKLANIELTPDKPTYEGGSWHYEAMLNERIVATAIYYYSQENITESRLNFRVLTQDLTQHMYGAHQNSTFEIVHNIPPNGSTVQEIGHVVTKDNRMIVFPNLFQHQVAPFELVDKTKPGHRKILVFFLCDPRDPNIITSSEIVAQQPAVYDKVIETLRETQVGQLPQEVFQMIVKELPTAISLDEAKQVREDLMAERRRFVKGSKKTQGFGYSL